MHLSSYSMACFYGCLELSPRSDVLVHLMRSQIAWFHRDLFLPLRLAPETRSSDPHHMCDTSPTMLLWSAMLSYEIWHWGCAGLSGMRSQIASSAVGYSCTFSQLRMNAICAVCTLMISARQSHPPQQWGLSKRKACACDSAGGDWNTRAQFCDVSLG